MLFLALNRVKEVLYFLETHSKDTASCESSYFKKYFWLLQDTNGLSERQGEGASP